MATSAVPDRDGDRASRVWCLTCRALYRSAFARCPYDGGELTSAEADPLVGTELAGRFVIERVLGEGGLGRVYAARHRRMSRRYAIKVPYGELTHEPVARARFLREADVSGRLEHPSIVAATDVGETENGLLYLAMDLAEGFGLDVVLQAGAMPGHRIPVLVEQLLSGLAHAHERGVVHRDLKPANVIVDRDRARIVDFGIAALAESDSGGRTRLTTEGTIIGTPHYMSPEQLSARPVDGRADLFSLGVMVYEMLSGKLPFDGAPMEIAASNMGTEPPRISARAPEAGPVDPLVEALARWLMEKDPGSRPQSASQALATLRLIRTNREEATRVLAPWLDNERSRIAYDSHETTRIVGRGATAASNTVPPPFRAPRRGHGHLIAIAALLALLLVGVGVWRMKETETETPTQTAQPEPQPQPEPQAQPQPEPQPQPPAVAVETPSARATRPSPPVTASRPSTPAPPAVIESPTPPPPPAAPAVTASRPLRPQQPLPQPTPQPSQRPPTSDTFSSRYTRVGESLSVFRKTHGDDAAADLLRRYRGIAYLDAVRKPDLRASAMRELDAIARAISSRP